LSPTTSTLLILLSGVGVVVGGILWLRLHAFLSLILGALVVALLTPQADRTIGERIAAGFGDTCLKIGILIAMASIIGTCLLESGAADRIVRTLLRWFGEAGAPLAFMLSGYVLGIPVFFDTVFYLMLPLGKAMRLRTGRNYLAYVLTIVCGATMTHSLVPPTPGPLVVAEELDVNLGTMILAGCVVSLVTATAGYFYAGWANRRWVLPLRDASGREITEVPEAMQVDEAELPPFWLSLAPVLLPVILIAGLTTLEELPAWETMDPALRQLFATLGEKNVAVSLAAVVALATVLRQRKHDLKSLAKVVEESLSSAGVIILITAAGGAFGSVLVDTDIKGLFGGESRGSPAVLCLLAFLVTVAIRTAQGSATVAMITAASVFKGVAFGAHPVFLALAIGCGSKPVAWMNDSGFWVMTRMSGMSEREGLKYITPMTTMMGVVGLVTVLIGVSLWPNL
jgi:GntP family gluconate:H+ symporter